MYKSKVSKSRMCNYDYFMLRYFIYREKGLQARLSGLYSTRTYHAGKQGKATVTSTSKYQRIKGKLHVPGKLVLLGLTVNTEKLKVSP